MFDQWIDQGLPVQLLGVGKDSHISSLGNWTNNNNAPVCADTSPFSVWSDWGASQRDLYVLDHQGNVILSQNVGSGLPSNLEALVLDLVSSIPDCDSDLVCGEAITCCDGMLYPTTCCSENCDEPIGDCGECQEGDINDDDPCLWMICIDGAWSPYMIVDCAEQMGVPCEGGVYLPPVEGECCSECVVLGDIGGDGVINILDVVSLVSLVLNFEYDIVADMNQDGVLNVLDVVNLVGIILE